MLSAGAWRLDQQNTITFVLTDNAGLELTGVGTAFNVFLAKAGGAFIVGTGDKREIGLGWYEYAAPASEADVVGPICVVVQAGGALQQNLEYVVEQRTVNAVPFQYTLTNSSNGLPLEGAHVAIATDSAGGRVVWSGYTDAFGVARDQLGGLPLLDPGTYFVFRQRSGFTFVNPDVEVVS